MTTSADRPAGQDGDRLVASQPLIYFLTTAPTPDDGTASKLIAHNDAIKALMLRLEKLVVPAHLGSVSELLNKLDLFRVQVSLVGQVKAGKTMLTNTLVGKAGLLPSDVNPWTSVVTSLHVNTPKPAGANAVFTFYTEEDWANLTNQGGHLGELAERAGFEDELVEMRRQVFEMQQRTENRLGPKFNLLLGASHSFSGVTSAIIDRYVCLGEDDAPALGSGRYADVTKLAELYLDDPSFGVPTTITDTPGVNDPFLARERATLQTLAATDICVVVLSAHQSFSTVDLALMRILSALQTDQIVLFVNRIDELENPDQQIPEIDTFIRGILRDKGISGDVPIVYGSAAWAEASLQESINELPGSSADTLYALAKERLRRAAYATGSRPVRLGQPPLSIEKARDLSGLNELKALLAEKSVTRIAAPFAAETLVRAVDLANQSQLLMAQVLEGTTHMQKSVDIDVLVDDLDNLLKSMDLACHAAGEKIADRMLLAMSSAYRDFIDTESARIRQVVKEGNQISDWSPDSDQLRGALNAAYHDFIANGQKDIAAIFADAAKAIASVYAMVLEDGNHLYAVRAPRVREPKIPATLMQTMTIDMKTTWIGNWLARAKGGETFVARFTQTVTLEMQAFLTEMREVHVTDFLNQSRQVLHDFLQDHLQTVHSLASLDDTKRSGAIRQKLGIEIEVTQRMVALKGLTTELDALLDAICADFGLTVE